MVFSLGLIACGDDDPNTKSANQCETRDDCAEGQRCSQTGVCTDTSLSCERSSDCDFGDYCVEGECQDGTCTTNDDCTDAICRSGTCADGCASTEECPQGEICNMVVNRCEPAGCTTGSCQNFQTCDETLDPPACQFTGECSDDSVCAAYANQVDDGNEYVCSSARQRCIVRPPCGSDTDCRTNEICDNGQCRRGCRENTQCGLGEICSTDNNDFRCREGCDGDADCPIEGDVCIDLVCIPSCTSRADCAEQNAGYICTGSPRICQGCSDTSQCPSTQFCDFTQGATEDEEMNPSIGLCVDLPPTCPDDSYGDNHDQNDAFSVPSFPFEPTGMDQPLYCQENSNGEWFQFNATAGDVVTVELNYPSGGNLDVALLKQNGEQLVASARPPTVDGGSELIEYGVELDQNFLVQVRGSILSDNKPYDIRIDVSPVGTCTDDSYEENDDRANAAVLAVDTDETGLQVCGDDRDFYELQAGANKIVSITAEAPVRLGDIDLYLYDDQGNILVQTTEITDVETFEYVTTAAQDLFLEVRVKNGVGIVDYDLRWTERDNVCTDQFELNDTCPAQTTTLGAGTYTDLNICSDADWYTVVLQPLQTVTFRATYDPAVAAGDLDITLFGPNDCATFIASEDREPPVMGSTTVTEVITYQAPTGGEYNLLASLFAGINVPYALEIDIQDGPPCTDDAFEPDDDTTDANVISATDAATGDDNIITGLKICDENEDWFAIDLAEGDNLEWQVEFDNSLGDLDAYLVGTDGQTVIASSTTTSGAETVTYTPAAGEAGTYYLRVEAKFSARNQYRVLTYLNGVGPVDPDCPDVFENNDSAAEATTISDGSYSLLVCGNPVDDDWFQTDVVAGEEITIDLLFSHADGNVDLLLFDDRSLTGPVRTSQSMSDNESITYKSARDQTLTWRVLTTSSSPSINYDMNITTVPAGTCDDDAFAPNGTSGTAAALSVPTSNQEGLYAALTKCEGTEDWFEIDLQNGDSFEAFINFDHSQADLNLEVFDPTMTPVGDGSSTTDDETVTITATTDGTYRIKVDSPETSRIVYDLMIYVNTVGPEDRQCPDPYENNDVGTQAASIPVGSIQDLLLCWPGFGNDSDFYSIFVPENATLTVDVRFSHSDGDINATLYRGSSSTVPVSESKSTDDDEQVTATNMGSGETYILWVYGASSGFTSRYDLDVGLSFSDTCTDDTQTVATFAAAQGAAETTSGTYDALTLCEGEEDWLKLPASTTSVEANVELNTLLGDIDIELLDSSQTVVASSTSTDNFETIDETGLSSAETYYLRIYPKNGAFLRNDYDLWLSVNGTAVAAPFCPDPYERNDSRTAASQLDISSSGQNSYDDMIACGEDVDWYQLSNLSRTQPPYFVELFFDHANNESDLAIEFTTTDGTAIMNASVDSNDNDEFITFSPDTNGTYLMRVSNVAGSTTETPYIAFIGREGQCEEDTYEPNDSFNGAERSAPDLGTVPGTFVLGSCPNATDDYVSFEVPSDGDYTVELLYNDTRMDLRGTVYFTLEVNGTPVGVNQTMASTGTHRKGYTVTGRTAGERVGILIANNTISGTAVYGQYAIRVTKN